MIIANEVDGALRLTSGPAIQHAGDLAAIVSNMEPGEKIKPIKSTLKKALEYIQNPDKTDDKMLVSSFGCSYETADIEFAFTLSQALDKVFFLLNFTVRFFL